VGADVVSGSKKKVIVAADVEVARVFVGEHRVELLPQISAILRPAID